MTKMKLVKTSFKDPYEYAFFLRTFCTHVRFNDTLMMTLYINEHDFLVSYLPVTDTLFTVICFTL